MSTNVPWRCSLELLAEPAQETEWLISGLLPAGSVVLFSGREGTMKTWLALDWALAVAEGQVWLGHQCESSAVLYVDAEMPGNLFLSRLCAIGGSRNLNICRWQDQSFPTRLDDPRFLKAALSHRLIIVDSLRRFMNDLDENSATDMSKITKSLRELTRHGATVVVLHHATKDPEKPAYRGSSELGAGVDVALHVVKHGSGPQETLVVTTSKTRFEIFPELTLRVERTPTRPVFHDIDTQPNTTDVLHLSEDLDLLARLIAEFEIKQGCSPNQSDIVQAARSLGSRNTILGRLQKGEGTRWHCEPDGRSRVYALLPTCPPVLPPRGVDGLDKTDPQSKMPSVLPTCSTGLVGKERLHTPPADENFHSQSHPVYPIGSRVDFDNGAGGIQKGIVQTIVEWPGYPDELCYVVDDYLVPPGYIHGSEDMA